MESLTPIDEALALALKLSPRQRIQLIERIASSVEQDIPADPVPTPPSDEAWGEKLVRMMDEFGAIEMIHPEIDDATEWVKQIRRDQEVARGINWDEEE